MLYEDQSGIRPNAITIAIVRAAEPITSEPALRPTVKATMGPPTTATASATQTAIHCARVSATDLRRSQYRGLSAMPAVSRWLVLDAALNPHEPRQIWSFLSRGGRVEHPLDQLGG